MTPTHQTLKNTKNIVYTVALNVGSEKHAQTMIIDTGSSWTWIAESSCLTCQGLDPFKASSSKSLLNSGRSFKITYGQGNVVGTMCIDQFEVSGL